MVPTKQMVPNMCTNQQRNNSRNYISLILFHIAMDVGNEKQTHIYNAIRGLEYRKYPAEAAKASVS